MDAGVVDDLVDNREKYRENGRSSLKNYVFHIHRLVWTFKDAKGQLAYP